MNFAEPLIPATLVRRYKRFLSDAVLPDGREITAHVANPGAMLDLTEPGTKIWLEPNDDPKRKLKFAWRMNETDDGTLIGVDTSMPNRIVKEALTARAIPELSDYQNIRPEVKYGENSRIDFLLTDPNKPDLYVEVKNVSTSRSPNLSEFPDCVTTRGAKHLFELAEMARSGKRAMMFYLVQRTDCHEMSIASDLDPTYGEAFQAAMAAGVEVLAYDCAMSPQGISIGQRRAFIR